MAEIVEKKVSQLNEVNDEQINDNSEFFIAYNGSNFKISLASLLKRVLGKVSGSLRSIGGNEDGSIVVVGAKQELDEQLLTSPKINSDAKVSVTSEEINYACDGASQNIPYQISLINDTIIEVQQSILELNEKASSGDRFEYVVNKKASGASEKITSDKILTDMNLSGRLINHRSIVVQYYKYDSGKDSMTGQDNSNILINVQSFGEDDIKCLDSIDFVTENNETYQYIITFRLIGE